MELTSVLFMPYTLSRLLPVLLILSDVESIYRFILSFSFSKIDIFVFRRMFSSTRSLTVCFNWSASEYNLSLSWWIFLGKMRAKSWVVRSGFMILICLRCWFLLMTDCSPISSELAWPQYPLKPGLADCGLNKISATFSSSNYLK